MSFSPPVFAALTPVLYLLAHLKPQDNKTPPRRANGRSSEQFRQPLINTNSLTYCNGSAVVRIGDTACVCGVRAEILRYEDIPNPPHVDLASASNSDTSRDTAKTANEATEISSLHLLVPNIDLGTTGCTPSIPPGQAPSTLAQSLSQRLYSLLTS
jgi:exosome complex component RRP43